MKLTVSKRTLGVLLGVLLLLACAVPVAAAAESDAVKTYTLPREELIKRIGDTVKKGQITYTSFYNIAQVSRADLQKAAERSLQSGGKVFINFETLSGNGITARITVNPFLVKSSEGSLCFIADASDKTNEKVKARFEKLFKKPVAVMWCGQAEDFGMSVVVSGKLDLSGLAREKLIAYSYNEATNSYTEIKTAKCAVDDQGFVYLQTKKGGYIVITNAE